MGGGNAQQSDKPGDGVKQGMVGHAVAALRNDATFLA